MTRAVLCWLVVVAGCAATEPRVRLTEEWPQTIGDYDATTARWTRKAVMRGQYQEVVDLVATFKSPEWRAVHADRDADHRALVGEARAQRFAQARAELAGPYELELLVTTWDRRENDLDRGKKSVWRLVLIADNGKEIEPLEVIRDKRPVNTLRAEFPAYGDFATAYIARFPRDPGVLGPGVRQLRLRMSGERGGVEVVWQSL